MSRTMPPLGDDSASAEKRPSYEQRKPEVPQMDTHQPGAFQTIPGSLYMQRTPSSTRVPFPGNQPPGPREPFTGLGASRPPAVAGSEPFRQNSFVNNAPASPTPAFARAFKDPLPFPGEELLQEEFLYNDDEPTQIIASVVKDEKKKSSWLKLVPRIAVAVVLFVFIFKNVDWANMATTLIHSDKSFLLLGLSAGLSCMVFSVYGWRALLLGERIRTDMARLMNLYMVGLAFSNFLPTSMGGDTVKVFYVGSESGNMPGAASAALMTRITSFTGMLLISVPAVIILRDKLDKTIVTTFLYMSLLLALVLIGVMVFSMLLPRMSTRFLSSKWTKNKVVEMVLKVLTAMNATLTRPGTLIAGIIFGMLFWVASFLNYYGYALALGINVPLSFYMIAIPFVSIVGALPISINGYGVTEGTFAWLFFTSAHVPTSTATLLALVMDVQVLLWSMIGGGIYLKMNFNARTSGVRNG